MAATSAQLDAVPAALPMAGDAGYVVAFSGGLDSTVLLHRLADAGVRPLRAVHVQHDLQAAAPEWAQHCRASADALAVPITVLPVRVARDRGHGPEAAAREARYPAIAAAMRPDEVLLTAHHADDQAQTFLLQALRGAGVSGLAGMPAVAEFGPGRHARPMLTVERDAIRVYARQRELDWLQDPSNTDAAVDRSYLDTHIWPAIRQHWPHAAATLSRAAAWCAESAVQGAERAGADLAHCAGDSPDCLLIAPLWELPAERRRGLLRHWLRQLGLPLPASGHIEQIESGCMRSSRDAQPRVAWPGAEVRRFGGRLFAMSPLPEPSSDWRAAWRPGSTLPLPGGGALDAERAPGGLAPGVAYHVRLRRGGERLRLPGRTHDTSLKAALQAAGVPPWGRARLPLIMAGERIAAVADLWVCDDFAADRDVCGWHPRWCDPPPGWPVGQGCGRALC